MLPNRLNDDPIALDFDSIRQRLQVLATQAFPAWTDHSSAGFGNVLLDLFAFSVELLGYAIEHQGRESRLATAQRRANVLAHARMLGYRPRGATAARASLLVSLDAPANDDITIPAGYVVRTRDLTPPVEFRVVSPGRLPKGHQTLEVDAEAAQTLKLVVDATGLPDQKYTLPQIPYLDGSVRVTDATAQPYQEVPNFLNSTAADRHYEVTVDESDRATLAFGSGVMGTAPHGRLDIEYKVGGGQRSNVEAESLTVAETPLFTQAGHPVAFKVTNPGPAEGGSDRESIEAIRRNAPESLRVANRTITREDFEINARKVPGVARALMLTSNEESTIEENTGRLFVVPHGGGQLSDELRERVFRQVTEEYPCTLTFQVDVCAPTYVPIHIDADVELRHSGAKVALGLGRVGENPSSTLTSVLKEIHGAAERGARHVLGERFRVSRSDGEPNEQVDFGFYSRGAASGRGDLAWSDIVAALCSVPEIRKVTRLAINGEQKDVALAAYEFPVLGRLSIKIAETKQ